MTASSIPSREDWPQWRRRLHEVIFEADTFNGKAFDVVLLLAILLSVAVVMIDSVPGISYELKQVLIVAEWFFTILFTAEYIMRLYCVRSPLRYVRSFFGVVDLLSILPSYISVALVLFAVTDSVGVQSLLVVRALRLLRVFRVFKLAHFLSEGAVLRDALWDSRAKIVVFLSTVMIIVCIMGSALYLVESNEEETQFTSIPQSVYWAIVTLTTVGYGDVTPQTPLGKGLTVIIMILGYSLIIVPTGFVSAEMVGRSQRKISTQSCPNCSRDGHDHDAKFCKFCGGGL